MSTTASPHGIDGATFDYSQLAKQNAGASSPLRSPLVLTYPEMKSGIQFMERATGHPVRVLLKQAGLLSRSTEDVHLLDNACGGGVVSSYLFERVDGEARKGLKVTCGDLEPKMLETTRERMAAEGWTAETAVVDAQVSQMLFLKVSLEANSPCECSTEGHPVPGRHLHARGHELRVPALPRRPKGPPRCASTTASDCTATKLI